MGKQENGANYLSTKQVLKDIFRMSEVVERAKTIPPMDYIESAGVFFSVADGFVGKWGRKDWLGRYCRTQPVGVEVDNEQVEIVIRSGKGRENVNILAKRTDMRNKDIVSIFSVDFEPDIEAKNIDGNKASLKDFKLAFGLLSIIGESLWEMPETNIWKTEENVIQPR